MANVTSVSGTALRSAARSLRELVTDDVIADFQRLTEHDLYAGPDGFDAAVWLKDLVIDRRHGLIEHAKNLRLIFDGLASTLEKAALTLSSLDEENAADLENKALTALNGWIESVVGAKLPPALGPGHHLTDRDGYDGGDTGGLPTFTSFEYGADGHAIKDADGGVHIENPLRDKADLPEPGLFDMYAEIIGDANKDGAGHDIVEDYVFNDDVVVVTDAMPEVGGGLDHVDRK